MKKLIFIIFIFAIWSCESQIKNQKAEKMEIGEITWFIPLNQDTIIERIDPAKLDLKKQQLFIDVSKNSIFKRSIKNWSPTSNEEIQEQIKHFEAQKSYPEIERKWITIRKYQGEFYNYDPCDGNDFRMEIKGNALILEELEKTIFKIEKVNFSKDKWILKSTFSPGIDLIIEKTNINNLYTLNFKSPHAEKKYYITSYDNIDKFNLIVNHCPNEKVREFDKFQDPE